VPAHLIAVRRLFITAKVIELIAVMLDHFAAAKLERRDQMQNLPPALADGQTAMTEAQLKLTMDKRLRFR